MSRLRRQVAKARHRCYCSDGGGRVVHNCTAKWHSFVYFKKYSSYPLQTWNSYSVSRRECIEARIVIQWPVFVELSALVDLDKIAIRRNIYSANSCLNLVHFKIVNHYVSPCIQGRYIVFVLDVCPSIKSCPLHSSKTAWRIFMKLVSDVHLMEAMCRTHVPTIPVQV